MSTIGLNTQFIPSLPASVADTLASSSISSIFQEVDNASGIGKVVSYPCITSSPNRRGICKRLFSTAIFCISLICFAPFSPKSPPSSPPAILCSRGLSWPSFRSPETKIFDTGRLSCPIFSSSVICDISLLIKESICWPVCALT